MYCGCGLPDARLQVNTQIQLEHGVALSRWESPQFINVAEIAFFLDRGHGICPDPFTVVIVNIKWVILLRISLSYFWCPNPIVSALVTGDA